MRSGSKAHLNNKATLKASSSYYSMTSVFSNIEDDEDEEKLNRAESPLSAGEFTPRSHSTTPLSGRETPLSSSKSNNSSHPSPRESVYDEIKTPNSNGNNVSFGLSSPTLSMPRSFSNSISLISPRPVTPHSRNSTSNSQITSSLNNASINIRNSNDDSINQIASILGTISKSSITSEAAAQAIYNIGTLTEKTLKCRREHKQFLPTILNLITIINDKLMANALSSSDVTRAITGISKLSLQSNIDEYRDTMEALFQKAVNNINQGTSAQSMLDLINASLRMDDNNTIFTKSLPIIIRKAYDLRHKSSPTQLCTLLYALASLDSNNKATLHAPELKLLNKIVLNNLIQTKSNDSLVINANNKAIDSNQAYQAVMHFNLKKPFVNNFDKELAVLRDSLVIEENSTETSKLQKELMAVIKKSLPDFTEEKRFDDLPFLPVDGCVQTADDKFFILQVDGPPHFLHDKEGNTLANKKSAFRDNLVFKVTGLPIVTVSYYEWNKKTSDEEKFEYLSDLVKKATGEPLPKQEWSEATPNYKSKNKAAFWNTNQSSSLVRPKSASSAGRYGNDRSQSYSNSNNNTGKGTKYQGPGL